MMIVAVTGIANLIVGVLIGISGVSGFLLPITFASILNLAVADSLTLSFASFLTYGVIGTVSYWRDRCIPSKFILPLCFSSVLGALAGVKMSELIPAEYGKLILYIVVLLSGLSLLTQHFRPRKTASQVSGLLDKNWFIFVMGFLISTVCTITGAGGAILLLPLLACLGMELRKAMGISMLESVFIAFPALIGYLGKATLDNVAVLILLSIICQATGFLTGTKLSKKIDVNTLKFLIALIAVGFSVYTLIQVVPGLVG